MRNDSQHKQVYTLRVQEMPWPKEPTIRRLIVQATDPEKRQVEMSVLCTHPTLDRKDAARLIFRRRLQAEAKHLAARCQELARRKAKATRGHPKLLARVQQLKSEIDGRKEELLRLESRLDDVVRDESRLRLLVEADCRRPDTRAKAILDAIRVTARNLFACLLNEEFRKHYDNLRDDAVILRSVNRQLAASPPSPAPVGGERHYVGGFHEVREQPVAQAIADIA